MAKIVGKMVSSFKGSDGTQVEGIRFFITEKMDPRRGEGVTAERVFLSNKKLALLDFTPEVGNEVQVFYNRFGKVDSMRLVDISESEIDF